MSNSVVFKCEFERQVKNKCSSYIDPNAKLNSIMQTTAQSKPKNYKKIKSFISHKLRKLLQHTPEHLHAKKTRASPQVQLLKFDYKSNFVAMETTEKPTLASRFASRPRRHSNGTSSSSSSTSSLSSCNSEQFFLLTSQNNDQQQQQQSELNLTENFVESSTPVAKSRVVRRDLFQEPSEPIAFSSYEDDCQMDQTCQLDESTQCQESPILLESTFNNSSLSNLSDDLIIVQTTSAPVQSHGPRHQSVDENLKMINKYHNDTNASFKQLPQWALGHNLNVALVNQLYYNPAARGVFNPEQN